ncbi:PPOX class probable FMN-dependent enzyme, DR_2398 family [Herbaspirillum sp. CF444]|uniref:pyridoxamine 5'-phosphate oxidase family protein n=1 Tax=Herbaspirillum sp. CF444 TaxID=1144319 RepID=UPI0002725263|nr:pyridoxamine 5'-phosphate oxidase family protein [Herbaspirillum sp. CF444]EJL81078.1 PPOX class probable FMN-dependent enzyme, DR_2398 family [Herbaspirillum sp. CF444]
MLADHQFDIDSVEVLEALFGQPAQASLVKERDHIDAYYRQWIAASPFLALATSGPDGLDCSPRGDPRGFVEVVDANTLILPERRGNNRIDSLRNLITDPRVALLFLIPGLGETLRINGRARISTDPALLERYAVDGKQPKVVLVITVETVFFQCSRAVARAGLWDVSRHVERGSLPTPGQILEHASQAAIDGAAYDSALPERVGTTLY